LDVQFEELSTSKSINLTLTDLKSQIQKLELDNNLSSKALSDKNTLIDVLHKKGRTKKQKIKQKCEELYQTTVSNFTF